MASASPVPSYIQIALSDGGSPFVFGTLVRAFDWTVEEGATESEPVAAGDFACTISAQDGTPVLFDFCARRPPERFDEALVSVITNVGGTIGSYRFTDCLVSSFRFHDAGGAAGLVAGLASLTFDWRKVDVMWDGLTRSYTKEKG